jgi:hypothetical protein
MNYEPIGPLKTIGKVKEQVYKITRNDGNVTIKDIENTKKKWLESGRKKYEAMNINMIKVLSDRWMTFTNEKDFNEFFENKVRDPSKFNEFDRVDFYVQYQE